MMVRKKIGSILESRGFRITFSILVAIALWVYVERIENKDMESGGIVVPVEFLNPELVADRKLIITNIQTETVTLEFSGKRSYVKKLYNTGAIRITANLADIAAPGLSMLKYDISYGDGVDKDNLTILSRSDDYIYVNVEKMFEKQVPIISKIDGENIAMEGFQAEAPIFNPATVTVYGPQSEVEQIDAVRVNIQRENLNKTVVADMPFVAVDSEREEVESDLIYFDRETVSVTLPIHMIKEIALTVNYRYGAGATVENTVVTISPETIVVSGEADLLTMNSIALTTIDLTQFDTYYSSTIPVILPNDITNLTGVTEAEITISIKGLETKTLSIPSQNIQLTNETPGYTTMLITTGLEVTLRGKEGELDEITPDNLRAVVDLGEYQETTGAFTVPARIRIDGVYGDSGAIGEYKVTVRVVKDGMPTVGLDN